MFILQNLDCKYFWPYFEKMAAIGDSLSVIKSANILLIIGCRELVYEANLSEIMD